jgi:hypothetical protein
MNYSKQKYGLGSSYDYVPQQNFEAMGSGPEMMPMEAGIQSGAGAAAGGAAMANPYVGAAMVGASFLSNYMKNLRDREDAAQRAQAQAAQGRFENESKGLDSMNNVFARSLLR